MAWVVSGKPLTMGAWDQSQPILCGICDGRSCSEMGFLGVLQFSSVTVIPLMVHTHL